MTEFPRFMIAAGASGSGKTMITCGLLQALMNRGLSVSSFKCGPDYIDPMFHEKVIHTKSRNLDTYFTDDETTRFLFARNARQSDISVMEGVMGFYDGLGGISVKASAYDLAGVTDTPVILIVNTKGMSLSVLAYIKGFLSYKENSHIKGVILNQMSPMIYSEVKKLIEEELGIHVYGYVPKLSPDLTLESRHLGLVLPGEIEQLEEKLNKVAAILEDSLEIDDILKLANDCPELPPYQVAEKRFALLSEGKKKTVKIAVARDEAFCFIYEDNLQLLRDLGAELIEFSPVHDKEIPADADGILLYGGYPELYAEELSSNKEMLADIKEKILHGLPCMAECGGFMYLHEHMEDMKKKPYAMAGVIPGDVYKTEKLGRFGYIELTEEKESGVYTASLRGHEFHYFDSTSCGDAFLAKKPLRKRSWKCIHRSENLLAGFPHLYYYANPEIAVDFLKRCEDYRKGR